MGSGRGGRAPTRSVWVGVVSLCLVQFVDVLGVTVVITTLPAIAASDLLLIWAAPSPWALPLCVAGAGAGIGLSSVAATGLGTDVEPARRGNASGIINTAAQLGTALGIAVLLLIAAVTTGTPGRATPVPAVAWGVAAAVGATGAAAFSVWGRRARPQPAGSGRAERAAADFSQQPSA